MLGTDRLSVPLFVARELTLLERGAILGRHAGETRPAGTFHNNPLRKGINPMALNWAEIRQFLEHLALKAFVRVRPFLDRGGEEILGEAAAGDLVARIDRVAGIAIRDGLSECPVPCALLDEEHGVLTPIRANPVIGIIADEFDGTRPGRLHMPTNAICLAAFSLAEEPCLKNVRCGVLHLMTREQFSFERSGAWPEGAHTGGLWHNGGPWTPPSPTPDPARLRIFYEIVGAHPALVEMYLTPLARSHRYGACVIASCSYVASRMLVGGVDGYVHLVARLRRAWPELVPLMDQLHGKLCGMYAWDLAAVVPLLWEAGCWATRSDGSSLTDVCITDGSSGNAHDFLAAPAELHSFFVECLRWQEELLLAQKDRIVQLLLDESLWGYPP